MSKGTSWRFHFRSLIGVAILVPASVVALLSEPRPVAGSWLYLVTDALGWIVFVAGAILRFWSTLYVGGRKGSTLVSEGPYSVCRNPLYVGSLLISFSVGIFLESPAFLVGVILCALAYTRLTIPDEERGLRETLGEEYVRYCERVPRFWPRLSQFRTPEVIEVKTIGLRMECARASRWIWLPVGMEVVARLRVEPWWPHPIPFHF